MKRPVLMLVLLCVAVSNVWAEKKVGNWRGFDRTDFQVDGRACYVVSPKKAAPGNPWVWRARFPGYHPEIDVELLKRGFHIAHMNTNGMLGSPAALKHWDAFYGHMTTKHKLSKKPALEAVSRGGLFVYRWTARHPGAWRVSMQIPLFATSRAGRAAEARGLGTRAHGKTHKKQYGVHEEQLLKFDKNPIDVLAPIAKANVPLMHIVTENDRVVPPKENTYVLRDRYVKLGGNMIVISVKEGTAKSKGHHFSLTKGHIDQAVDFIIKSATENRPAKEDSL